MCENPAGGNLKHTRRPDNRSRTQDKHVLAAVWGRFLMDSEDLLGQVFEFGDRFDFRSEENLISNEKNGGGSINGAVAAVTVLPSLSCIYQTCLLIRVLLCHSCSCGVPTETSWT